MIRYLFVSLALLGAYGCGTGTPAPAQPSPSAAPEPTATGAAPAASATEHTEAPADDPSKPPATSSTRKAVLVDQMKGTPLVTLHVTDAAAATCSDPKLAEGATMLELTVYWKPGNYDIGTKTKTASAKLRELKDGKWKSLPDVIKGDIQVREAPLEPGKTGRLHVRAERSGQPIDEELDVAVCVPVDPAPLNKKK